MPGRLIAVVGPSGVGKDTVMAALANCHPNLALAHRVITRPATAIGEEFDGVSLEQFHEMKQGGAFALAWEAHGLCYGIPIGIEATLANGTDVLANLSRAVLPTAASKFKGMVVLSLTARTEILQKRLEDRGRRAA